MSRSPLALRSSARWEAWVEGAQDQDEDLAAGLGHFKFKGQVLCSSSLGALLVGSGSAAEQDAIDPTPPGTEETLVTVEPLAPPPAPSSAGSLGHPEFCVRPCVYFAKGGCHLGAECKYCHEAHNTHPKFDKRQRTTVQALSAYGVLSLLHPVLARKGQQLRIRALLNLIEAEMDRLGEPEEPELPANLRRQMQARPD